ncbi:uracil-DNA glycosylase isoform X2 [Aplysia californica]|nr:uracil-DNA glycosylase isoform X2 [Aplysia californica]XP_012942928.1 uracil-DNA glycosylase isoform X2 [Aplysia californica]XP_035828040.1 uracil-DNA glycosylase isoform X2 [Aplysia californica]
MATPGSLSELLKEQEWKQALKPEFSKDYFKNLEISVMTEFDSGPDVQVFPPKDLIFNALALTPLKKVKVVLLGQDPYHDDGQAMGLAFSVPKGVKVPPSLRNIYKELSTDIAGFKDPGHGCLEKWARQGVLLLNATLTVQAHEPNSHSKFGWQTFTDAVIKTVSDKCQGVVFMLWGNFAHKKEKLVDSSKHSVLKFAHPSPLSFGKFKDCKCFSQVNSSLAAYGKEEIDWTL